MFALFSLVNLNEARSFYAGERMRNKALNFSLDLVYPMLGLGLFNILSGTNTIFLLICSFLSVYPSNFHQYILKYM